MSRHDGALLCRSGSRLPRPRSRRWCSRCAPASDRPARVGAGVGGRGARARRNRRRFDSAGRGATASFGLTGAVYSTSQSRLERAKKEFHVGNLYLNRKCTGALVGVHPFGGFNMSGTDSKAGGREYLLQFMQAKSVAQRL